MLGTYFELVLKFFAYLDGVEWMPGENGAHAAEATRQRVFEAISPRSFSHFLAGSDFTKK